MAHKSVTVIQKANEQINETYLAILCKNYPLYMGLACMHDGKLTSARIKGAPTVATFKQMTEEFGKSTMMFVVGSGDNTLLDEDMQPFELLKDKDGELVAVGSLAGDFANHSVVKSSHTNEYHCVNSVLIPKLRKLYKSVGEGIPELIEELKDPVTAADFAHYWGNYGDITILTSEGVTTFSAKNIRGATFNWGYTSDALNYKEQTVAKSEPVKELSAFEKLKAKMTGKEATAPAPDAAVPDPVTGSSAAAIVAASEDEFEMVGPAPQDLANKDKISWWVAEVGYKPEGYKLNTTKVKRQKGTKVGVLHALAATNVSSSKTSDVKDAATPISNDTIKAEAKAAAAAPQPEVELKKSDTAPKHVSTDNLPLLSPKQKLQLKTGIFNDPEVMKILGDDHRSTLDPKLLKEFEENYATFTDGMGFGDLDTTMNWPFELFLKLGASDVKALAIYAFNCRNEMYKTKTKLRSILADPANKIATKLAM